MNTDSAGAGSASAGEQNDGGPSPRTTPRRSPGRRPASSRPRSTSWTLRFEAEVGERVIAFLDSSFTGLILRTSLALIFSPGGTSSFFGPLGSPSVTGVHRGRFMALPFCNTGGAEMA